MKTYFDIRRSPQGLTQLSRKDRDKVLKACCLKAFRHLQTWAGLLVWIACIAAGYCLGVWVEGIYKPSWLAGLPYLNWATVGYLVVPRIIVYTSVVAGFSIFCRIHERQSQAYWQSYIEEHRINCDPHRQELTIRITGSQILVLILVVTNGLTAAVLGAVSWNTNLERTSWRSELEVRAGSVGALQASRDFRAGRKRLYVLQTLREEEEGRSKFTGRREGTLPVWTYPVFPILGKPQNVSARAFVEKYNYSMRRRENMKSPLPSQVRK